MFLAVEGGGNPAQISEELSKGRLFLSLTFISLIIYAVLYLLEHCFYKLPLTEISKTNRVPYLDYLRVFAMMAVICIHVSANKWYSTPVTEINWHIFNFYDSIVRWAVPVFVMISGSLFLNPNKVVPIRTVFTKYIVRIGMAFIIFSTLYSVWNNGFKIKLFTIIHGEYHMWYLLMIMGLYMCIPMIKPLVTSGSLLKYFLAIFIVINCLLPFLSTLSNDFANDFVKDQFTKFNNEFKRIDLKLFDQWVGYFILGFYLSRIKITAKIAVLAFITGISGSVLTIVLDSIVAIKTNQPYDGYYGHLPVLFMSISVFVITKYCVEKIETEKNQSSRTIFLNNIVRSMSKFTFGAYLCHVFVISITMIVLSKFDMSTRTYSVISVPIICLIVFICSYLISFALTTIPFIRKYM